MAAPGVAPRRAALVLAALALWGPLLGCWAASDESNILRLGRPRSAGPARPEAPGNASEAGPRAVPEFSKNNPELDWKSQLRRVAEMEEKTRPKELDLDFMRDRLEKNANSIQWLADLYDPLRWTKIPGDVSGRCREDMTLFLSSLKLGQLWAAKREFSPTQLRVRGSSAGWPSAVGPRAPSHVLACDGPPAP
jgi:hypothetical protein